MTQSLCWQVAFTAVSACMHCEQEHCDTSAKALIATLRKRLSVACDSLQPYVCISRVRWRPRHLMRRLCHA